MRGILRHRSQFQQVYREGTKAVGRLLVVYALPREEPTESSDLVPRDAEDENELGTKTPPHRQHDIQFGVVASKKVGGAVARNRGKRLLRASFRDLRVQPGRSWWLVFVARAAIKAPEVRSTRVREEMARLLSEVGIRADPHPPSRGQSI